MEAGSTGEYDLFAMFPEKAKGKSWQVQDLTDVGLRLGGGWLDHYSMWTAAWLPEWVDIHVNGQKLLRKKFQLWLDNWLDFAYVLAIGKDEL